MQLPLINKHTPISCLILLLLCSTFLSAQITVDRFMGVNTLREDPIEKMKAVGFIREYHSWYLNEGNPSLVQTDFSPSYPNAVYRWDKVYQDLTFTRFGEFYNEIRNVNDIHIAPSFLGNLFQIVDPSRNTYQSDNHIVQEQIPVVSGANTEDPASYKAHAAYLYHYAARYGHNTFNTSDFTNIIMPRTHPEETPKTGLGLVEYMESWNEQDKWWWRGTNPTTYFEPEEYATMLSADYDGHGNTLGTGIGIKNADPNMKVVMGGLAEANLDYIRKMVDWSKTNRSANFTHGILPFQVLNIHHYIGNNENFLQSTQGVSPEHAGLQAFLKTFDDYRDSLNTAMGTDLELWLSEFGYDTFGEGSTGVPVVVAPQIGPNDSYEVQGQWITRIYLAALAAEIDRAMLFFLRDEQTPYTGLYSSSGLLENATNNYKPKNSWFYTYTMKNVLTDMVFDGDISPCSDTTCAKIFKFKHVSPNNPKIVYALWSPTSSAKVFDYEFNEEDVEGATLVNMELPSIHGTQWTLSEPNPTIEISERPLFIIKDGNYFTPPTTCAASPTVENATCSSINVRLNAPDGSGKYQLWHMEGNFSAVDFSHRLATLVDEDLSPSDSVITVANLKAEQPYTFFLFPEGVGESETNKICTVTGVATDQSCKIPINPTWIFDEYKNTINQDGLFDNQNDFDPMCEPNAGFPSQDELWGFNFNFDDSMYVSIDLQAYYYIDAITIHDEGSRGFLTIEMADSPNGPWTTVADYLTIDYNVWKTLTNLIPAHIPVRYMRFIAEKNDAAKVGELFLCGRLSDFAPNIVPGKPINGTISNITCESMTLTWDPPFDPDVQGYKIIRNGGSPFTLNNPGSQTYPIANLTENTLYEFSIITIDIAGQESADTLKLSATTHGGINLCKIPLNSSMIFDYYEKFDNAKKLVDEQNAYDPLCNPSNVPSDFWGTDYSHSSPEYVSLDLQAYYDIDDIIIHDGGGLGGNIKVQKADSPNGPWTTVIDYDAEKFNDWVTFNEPVLGLVRYLRFEASGDDDVATGEIFICGEENPNFTPDIKPGKGKNGQLYDLSCTEAGLVWEDPFDTDIQAYKIFGGAGNPVTVSYDVDVNPMVLLNNLLPETEYTFKIITIDVANQESEDTLYINTTTYADGECDLACNLSCPCAICIRPSWVISPTSNTAYNHLSLIDNPDQVPFCGSAGSTIDPSNYWGKPIFGTTGPPPDTTYIEFPEFYEVTTLHYFSGGSTPGSFNIAYLDINENWQEIIATQSGMYAWQKYDTAPFITNRIRLVILDENARIGEIGICGTPYALCPSSLVITQPITQTDTLNAEVITASSTITQNIDVAYLAANSVTLTDGFHAMANSNFLAAIAECIPNFSAPSNLALYSKLQTPQIDLAEKTSLTIFPNPFKNDTTIAYQTSQTTPVKLDIFNSSGKIFKTLINNKLTPKGQHKIAFSPSNQQGGFYIARLRMGSEVFIKKMVVIRQ